MGDADSQRIAKNTGEIASHLQTMCKILETLNKNLVDAIRSFRTLVELADRQEIDNDKNAYSYETEITPDKVLPSESPKRHFQ